MIWAFFTQKILTSDYILLTFFQTSLADNVKVILKEYLLAMTSILILQHFVKTPHCICSAIVGCYAKEMVAMEIL